MTKDLRICHNNYKCKEKNGNCRIPGEDGLPVQCVGKWVENKYYFLVKFLNASKEVRRKFSTEGNAIYIDLFSGSGKCIIRNNKKEILNGGMRVIEFNEVPFNNLYFFDKEHINIEAFKIRAKNKRNCFFKAADSNIEIKTLVRKLLLNPNNYHFAFIDPFGPEALKFETIKELAKLKRMDMLIHFPIGPIKRNINNWVQKNKNILNELLGTEIWQDRVLKSPKKIYTILIETFLDKIKEIGYIKEYSGLLSLRNKVQIIPSVAIRNTKNVRLYDLVFISKHDRGLKIWESIIRIGPNGQKHLF